MLKLMKHTKRKFKPERTGKLKNC